MKQIISLNDINIDIPEGQLLLAAIAIITTTTAKNKTPEIVLEELNTLSKSMFDEK